MSLLDKLYESLDGLNKHEKDLYLKAFQEGFSDALYLYPKRGDSLSFTKCAEVSELMIFLHKPQTEADNHE